MKSPMDNSADRTPKILCEQTRFAFDVFPITASILSVATIIMGFMIWSEIDNKLAGIWFLLAIAVVVLRFVIYYLYKANANSSEHALRWQWAFIAGALSSAVMISAAGFIFFPDLSIVSKTVFMLLVLGVISGALPVLAMNLKAYGVYVMICILPLIYCNLISSDIQFKLLGALSIVYIGMLIMSGHLFDKALIDSFIYRYRSESLAERLQTANNRLSTVNKELERISTVDELTGTYNRRYFNQRYEEVWADHLRENHTLSALMIDVDYFKTYNDNFGHLQGDNCLKRIAQEIIDVIRRPRDFVARFGGEEFIMLLPNTELVGAKEIALRIHKSVARLGMPHKRTDGTNRVTVSIGGTSIAPTKDNNNEQFLQKVDHALYQAKNSGRNGSFFI